MSPSGGLPLSYFHIRKDFVNWSFSDAFSQTICESRETQPWNDGNNNGYVWLFPKCFPTPQISQFRETQTALFSVSFACIAGMLQPLDSWYGIYTTTMLAVNSLRRAQSTVPRSLVWVMMISFSRTVAQGTVQPWLGLPSNPGAFILATVYSVAGSNKNSDCCMIIARLSMTWRGKYTLRSPW